MKRDKCIRCHLDPGHSQREKRLKTWSDKRFEQNVNNAASTMLRVHIHGWPNRPRPEPPKRGRGSQPLKKKKKCPRKVTLNPGDMVVLTNASIDFHVCSGKFLVKHLREYCFQCEPASVGPYVYINRYQITYSEGNLQKSLIRHRLLLGSKIMECDDPTLDIMRLIHGVSMAKG